MSLEKKVAAIDEGLRGLSRAQLTWTVATLACKAIAVQQLADIPVTASRSMELAKGWLSEDASATDTIVAAIGEEVDCMLALAKSLRSRAISRN